MRPVSRRGFLAVTGACIAGLVPLVTTKMLGRLVPQDMQNLILADEFVVASRPGEVLLAQAALWGGLWAAFCIPWTVALAGRLVARGRRVWLACLPLGIGVALVVSFSIAGALLLVTELPADGVASDRPEFRPEQGDWTDGVRAFFGSVDPFVIAGGFLVTAFGVALLLGVDALRPDPPGDDLTFE